MNKVLYYTLKKYIYIYIIIIIIIIIIILVYRC